PIDGQRADGAVVCLATSGTAGAARLVPLTMANLTASAEASRARLGTGADDRWLACLPLTHIGGLSVLLRSFEAGGAAVVGPFGDSTPTLIERMRPSVASFVPTMVHRLVEADPDAIASIDLVLVGGASLSTSLFERARTVGVNLVPTYGMTETSSQVATPSPGQPLDGFTVSIASPQTGGPGRIIVDGPAVFSGYLGEDARTGPFITNDIGVMAPDGSLTVLGRADDVVITGGENVSLSSVQDVLTGIAGIHDVVVVGVGDDEWGTAVCALVVAPSLERAQQGAEEVLASHEVPKRWATTDRIPLLPNGKVDSEAVRSHFEAQAS
ncbi:MAG: class I adenylate-forming enzyme family protein, partial [Acidimicrobiia bacterium]